MGACSLAVKIVVHAGFVVTADGDGSVKQGREHIAFDVPNVRGVFAHTLHDVLDMRKVQFQQSALNHFGGFILAADTDGLSLGAYRFNHEFKQLVYFVNGEFVLFAKALVIDIFLDYLSVNINRIHRINLLPLRWFSFGRSD